MNIKDYSLRKIRQEDLQIVLSWRNQEHIRKYMYNDSLITMEEHNKWFERINNDLTIAFNIFEYKGKPLGIVNFYNIDNTNSKGYWGFYLGEVDLPKGTGLILGYVGLKYAFEKLGLNKVIGEAISFNTASINYHQKLGFLEEGRFVKHIIKNGKYEDVLTFAIFKENWLENKHRLEKLLQIHVKSERLHDE